MTPKMGKAVQIILQEIEDRERELDMAFLKKQLERIFLKAPSFERDIEIQTLEIKMDNIPGRWGQYLGRK